MSIRKVVLFFAGPLLIALGVATPSSASNTGGDGEDGGSVTATADSGGAVGSNGTGSSGQPPTSTPCTAWVKYDPNTDPDPIHAVDIYINAAGETVRLYVRTCPASGREYSWVHELTALDAAKAAHDEVTRKLPRLQPQLAPPTSFGGVVNINTWIGLDPPAPVSVTASVPGFSSTVTATASRVAWSPGDGSTVECGNLGVVWHPGITTSLHDAPCGWTPKYPSLAKYTGTDDKTYHGEFRVIWTITWSGSDGRSGTFAEITVTTPTTYKVSEIQTIGAG